MADVSVWSGRCGGFAVLRQGSEQCRRLLDGLGDDPDLLLRTARIVKPGSRTHAGIVAIDGLDYFLKRYNDRGWWYRFRNLLLTPRAVRTWRIHWEMYRRGLPVPQPYLCLVERRYGLLRRSYILMDYAVGTLPLYRVWPTLAYEQRRGVVAMAGRIIGRFHREGIVHRDYKWSNLIVSGDDRVQAMTVVDLDASQFVKKSGERPYRKDLDRFLRDLPAGEDAGELRRLFLESWREARHGRLADS